MLIAVAVADGKGILKSVLFVGAAGSQPVTVSCEFMWFTVDASSMAVYSNFQNRISEWEQFAETDRD